MTNSGQKPWLRKPVFAKRKPTALDKRNRLAFFLAGATDEAVARITAEELSRTTGLKVTDIETPLAVERVKRGL